MRGKGGIYGPADVNFSVIAKLQEAYDLGTAQNVVRPNSSLIAAHDVALHQALVKIGRIATGVLHDDNYVDAIGYINLAYALVLKIREEAYHDSER